jgi:hypothetical protein
MLWEDLDAEAKHMLVAIVEAEANRFIAPGYRVPYWADREKVIYPGDTKAEDNAWNCMILHVAVAMMPEHPNVQRWRWAGSELMVSAFSLKKDMEANKTVLDGKAVKDWLKGYNVREDGAVINHAIVHPDYMTYEGREMETARMTADAFVLHWLHARNALSGKKNWLQLERP